MAIQRLDALVWLTLTGGGFQRRGGGGTGYIKETYLAHLIPQGGRPNFEFSVLSAQLEKSATDETDETDQTDEVIEESLIQKSPIKTQNFPWTISEPLSLDDLADQDFLDLVEGLESEFQAEFVAKQVDADQDKVLLVGVMTQQMTLLDFEDGLAEITRLVESAGGQVLQTVRQKRSRPHPQTVVGEGKVQEISLTAQTISANLVVFDRDLSPAQIRNLSLIHI